MNLSKTKWLILHTYSKIYGFYRIKLVLVVFGLLVLIHSKLFTQTEQKIRRLHKLTINESSAFSERQLINSLLQTSKYLVDEVGSL